jgi:hypothetical protein
MHRQSLFARAVRGAIRAGVVAGALAAADAGAHIEGKTLRCVF